MGEPNATMTNNNAQEEEQKEEDIKYKVWFLNHSQEYIASIHHIRTYVPPLPSQLSIGMKINANWTKDNKFYPAIIEDITEAGDYRIKFTKYNEYSCVSLYDIQLINKKDKDTNLIKRDGKSGNLVIAENAIIPQRYWSRDDDTPTERLKKRKKIKSIKRQHRNLKKDVESKNRANSWLKFKSKSLKKSKKKFQSTLLGKEKARSIFESPSMVTNTMIETTANMTQFKQRTHFHHLKKDPKQMKKSR